MQATVRNDETSAADSTALLVVQPDDDGFQVYAPAEPNRIYRVGGSRTEPECTCAEFRWKRSDSANGHCAHIDAVLRHLGESEQPNVHDDGPAVESRPAPATSGNGSVLAGTPALLTLKRSVSPDGKIDSLSVEFVLPIAGLKPQEVYDFALRGLDCQEDIVGSFLSAPTTPPHRDNGREYQSNGSDHGNGAVSATLRDIGGMQTKWGWRYFINVEANGGVYKLFGNRKQLAEHLANAGHPRLGDQLSKGKTLNVPCLAVLEDSEDGRYTNVVELRPANRQQSARR